MLTSLIVTTVSDAPTHTGTSLRDAVSTANTDVTKSISDTITFDPSLDGQTITLTQGQLELGAVGAGSGAITINGASQVTVSGANSSRDFQVDANVQATLSGLTVTGGFASIGSGIYNQGILIVSSCTITDNKTNGAANCDGGGILNSAQGTLSLTNCTISNNAAIGATADAGGLDNFAGGIVTVTSCSIFNNTAAENGGGIGNTGTMTVYSSTINNNSAVGQGGGIGIDGTMTVIDCTIAGNSAAQAGGIGNSGTLVVSFSTISGNTAAAAGGIGNAGTLQLLSTLVAGNTGTTADPDLFGSVQVGSTNNLIGDGTGLSGITNGSDGNLVGTQASPVNALLGALSNNGGTTQTMALLSGSPAIGAGGALTTLTSAIGSSDTSFAVANAAAIASTPGSYVIGVDSEQLLVTSVNLGNNTVTVQRGYNGTSAVGHNAGTSMNLALDQRGVARVGTPDVGSFNHTSSASPLTITGAVGDSIQLTFSDATHFTVAINGGAPTQYSTLSTDKVIYNGPAGGNSLVVFDDPVTTDNYLATQSLSTTSVIRTGGVNFEFDANSVQNLYIYASDPSSNASISLTAGTGANFFVGAANGGYSYLGDPAKGIYSELSGFLGETVNGSGGTTYAYLYSASHGAAVGNPGGTSTYTLGGVTSNLSNFPQLYVVGAADGTDSVTLHSAGGTFVGTPNFDYVEGTLSGASFLIGAVYAANVAAASLGTADTAVLYSYPSNTFNGTPGSSSTLSGSTTNVNAATTNFQITADGFHNLSVFESGSGSDTANLSSPGNGSFFGTPTASSLTVGTGGPSITINTYFTPSGGQPTAVPNTIVVTGNHDSTDEASIADLPGSNALVAGGSQAVLTTSLGSVTINKFGNVTATKGNGSSDTVHMASAIDFVLSAPGWTVV